MKGRAFLTDRQALLAAVLGLDVDGDGGVIALLANTSTKVWDKTKDSKRPVLVRIQNISDTPIFWSENKGLCNANQFNGVLQADTVGGANPAGNGGGIEFEAHIPKDIYIMCTAARNVCITLRYADQN